MFNPSCGRVLSANPDADPAAVEMLHRAGGARSLLETKGKVLPVIKYIFGPVMRLQKLMGNISARGFVRISSNLSSGGMHPNGTTAVHIAAQRGHVEMVKAMARVAAHDKDVLQAKDKFGLTPLARARHTAAAYSVALEPVLQKDSGNSTVVQAPAKAPSSSLVQVTRPPAQVAPKGVVP